jgi:beta-lactamase superfamily II metal-dependent hydrolase
MSGMMKTSELTTKLPGAFFYTASPTFPDFVIYYAALIAIISGFALRPKRRRWMIIALTCVIGFYGWRWHQAQTTTQLSIVPANGGCCIYCNEPGSANDLLVNCGNDSAVDFVVVPFLHAQGVNRLPRLVLTHGAAHQIGGTFFLRELLPINEVFTSKVRFRSPAYRRITDSLEHDDRTWRQLDHDDSVGNWTVLHPGSAFQFQNAEDAALVLRGELQGIRVLLLSDLGRSGQQALLNEGSDLRADIVVTGIPNNNEPLRDGLLDAIQPRLIIIADSEYPASRRASRALVQRLESRNIPVVYTRAAGAVTVTLRKARWTARSVSGEKFSGNHSPELPTSGIKR